MLQLAPVHSAGYAAYVWLGHAFTTVVPFGSDAARVNLWSAFAGAAAVGLTARYLLVVSRSVAGAAVAALLLATGPIFFYNATVASVYAFLAFAVALLLNAADAWLRRPSPWRLALLALAIGLVGLAHVAGASFALGGLVLIALSRRGALARARDVLPLAAALVPVAAVPLLARAGGSTGFPRGNSDASLWEVVADPVTDFPIANEHGIVVHSWWVVLTLLVSLSPAALVLVPAGVRRLWSERPYVLCCLGPALLSTALAVVQRGGYAYWYVPLILAGALACGAGVEAVRRSAARFAIGVALLVTPLAGGLYLGSSHREASGWSRATLGALPRGARLVTPWISYTPMRALQVVDGVRRDVQLELTPTGAPADIATLGSEYTVDVAADPRGPRAVPVGPAAGANFKGLSGLEAGPFAIGFDPLTARAYRLPR